MRALDYTDLETEIIDFIERDEQWFFGVVVPPRLARPLCAILASVRQRNPADVQLTLPVGFTTGDAFVEQCRGWIGAHLEKMPDMPPAAAMPTLLQGRDPATSMQAMAAWVREQMPQSANRRLTVALVPPVVLDPGAYHRMLVLLSSHPSEGPSLQWVASTPDAASFPRELLDRPGTMAVAVQAGGGGSEELGSPAQRALGGLQAAGQALANGNPEVALCWCRVLTLHAVVRDSPVLLGFVLQAQGDAFRGLGAWHKAHGCYRRALVAFMNEPASGALLGGVLAALAVSGTRVDDPFVPHYVAHAQRLKAEACFSAAEQSAAGSQKGGDSGEQEQSSTADMPSWGHKNSLSH